MAKYFLINSKEIIDASKGEFECVIDGSKINGNEVEILVKKDALINLLIVNTNDNFSVNLNLEEYANVNLSILLKTNQNSVKMVANLAKSANLVAYCADFSTSINKSDITINLNEENANAEWHLASISSNDDKKTISVSINHNHFKTYATVENYGVCKGNSKLVFSGTSYIKNGSYQSKTRQNAKIMVFDKTSDAVAKPILKIDENDVEASHGAVVGKINDEHMFYLTSRGISREEARTLITLGYLKPILKGFNNEEEQNEILSLIEGRI